MRTSSGLAALATLWFPTVIEAQDRNYYADQVSSYLERAPIRQWLTAIGFREERNRARSGYVASTQGAVQEYELRVEAGYAYAVIGACDEDCSDIDLGVYDATGQKITEDTEADDSPAVWLFAGRSGSYRIRVATPGCRAPFGCHVGVRIFTK